MQTDADTASWYTLRRKSDFASDVEVLEFACLAWL